MTAIRSRRASSSRSRSASTRGYERSLEPIDESVEARGTSKSNASRALIEATTERLTAFVSRKLDAVDLVAMFIDGIEFAGHAVVIALGVTIDGTKEPLGIWAGSTENSTVTTALLSDLVDRGLRVEESMLFVIDRGKASRKALRDVFGGREDDPPMGRSRHRRGGEGLSPREGTHEHAVARGRPASRSEGRGGRQEGRVRSRSHRRRCYANFNARRGVPPIGAEHGEVRLRLALSRPDVAGSARCSTPPLAAAQADGTLNSGEMTAATASARVAVTQVSAQSQP